MTGGGARLTSRSRKPCPSGRTTPRTCRAGGWFVDVGVVNARWFGVPQDPRKLTLDEVGRLQGFPAGYPWPTGAGNRSAAALRIANAVPPPMYAGIVAPLLAEAVPA